MPFPEPSGGPWRLKEGRGLERVLARGAPTGARRDQAIESAKEDDPNEDLNFWDIVCGLVHCDNKPIPTPQDVSEAGSDRNDDHEYRQDWADSVPKDPE